MIGTRKELVLPIEVSLDVIQEHLSLSDTFEFFPQPIGQSSVGQVYVEVAPYILSFVLQSGVSVVVDWSGHHVEVV